MMIKGDIGERFVKGLLEVVVMFIVHILEEFAEVYICQNSSNLTLQVCLVCCLSITIYKAVKNVPCAALK